MTSAMTWSSCSAYQKPKMHEDHHLSALRNDIAVDLEEVYWLVIFHSLVRISSWKWLFCVRASVTPFLLINRGLYSLALPT